MLKLDPDNLEDNLAEFVDPGQRRPPRLNVYRPHKPKKDKWEVRSALTERPALGRANHELAFGSGLNATNEERAYLFEQLSPFFGAKFITHVLQRVKGGKEANVYCCAAHPATGQDLIAAKVYRPRQFRNLKNDSQYRQGRALLTTDGQTVDLSRDWRLRKAIEGKSRKGLEATQASWVAYEFQTMKRLHSAGVDVPEPYHNSQHALLMEYFGDVTLSAPTLHLVTLDAAEAQPLFNQLMRDVEIMLAHGIVHGDLSAYNVLYWEGAVTIIDFPQMVDPHANPDARAIFGRDVERLCQYFARYGVRANPRAIASELWQKHIGAHAK